MHCSEPAKNFVYSSAVRPLASLADSVWKPVSAGITDVVSATSGTVVMP
ncbi:hypothetical protein [Streptomyces glaucus]